MINPKDIIKKYTVEELCQTADEYYKSISDPTHQIAKPFSSLMEAPEMLQNIGLLLSGLKIAKTMTILEFAAGTCWFSRYLNQLQCRTISCDVSNTALEIGKRLFREYPIIGESISEPIFLHFDGHKIDLPDESVDRIICNDGFHHVPNQEEVISEFARVLKNGGIAGFSEPGGFHSQTPQSQYEMNNFAVLENDILMPEIFEAAWKYGFTDASLKVLGDIDVSIDQFHFLSKKFYRKLLKKLFNIDIGKSIVDRTIFFLYKGQNITDSRSHIGLSHSLTTDKNFYTAKAGENLFVLVRVSNTGSSKWLIENINDIGVVRIGTHLYDNKDKMMDLDFSRHDIATTIEPGARFEQFIGVKFEDPGIYRLAIDLVSENICWFETVGSIPKFVTIKVE